MGTVTSRDGTRIAYQREGSGPPLILVDAAGHFRANSSLGELASLLAPSFTVYRYDRRGRGDSTDTPPYAPEREVEDIAALIAEAGAPTSLYGYSSGGLLALHAAAAGLDVHRLALLEPPLDPDDDPTEQHAFTARLTELTGVDAVRFFLGSIGVPEQVLGAIHVTPHWDAMVSVAHTLAYDARLSEATGPSLLARVTTTTLVLDSLGSTDDLTGMAATTAALLPAAEHLSLTGEWHGVPAQTLAPVLAGFLRRDDQR
ncbi:Pimeloyl-ACP methyl ester carboxylesterase [Micromonospora phaseoli]|uniref:Pimeloyl-ACP methyl ester carboxylesterase n=1 Tax=Micromonospora phaseoli TaxID=1144548 RepID=A0A1H7D5H8_9ACTN|nr:alpha/beta fold hydrolase [Micromonospora phaseoli]PZV90782.1 pimeloyl-ACP methyl ester carboxylesterase [Micromonospora phaseoli]SEJ97016.1 Pimeloyl-ACP methyl ester carboxylesterase [Micromonospora phaseoli]